MKTNILQYLEESAGKYPNKIACMDEKEQYTFKELMEKARIIGSNLSEVISVNEPVPVFMEKSPLMLAVFMGIVYAGGFYVAIDVKHPKTRVDMILDKLEAKIIVTDTGMLSKLNRLETGRDVYCTDALTAGKENAQQLQVISEQLKDTDPLYAIFTSGSTGVPKGVVVSHRSVIDFIDNFTEIFGITKEDVIGNQAPFDFDVSVKDIYSSLKTGATLVIIPKAKFSFPTKLLDYLDDNKVTTLIWAVSALCIVTTLKGFEYKRPSAINKVIFSGEVMPINHLNAWREQYKDAMFANVYGPTEITCNCTYYIVDREFDTTQTLPMGNAFPNEKVFLLDEDDKLVDRDEPGKSGEVCVSGSCLALGYFGDWDKTNKAFTQNPLNRFYLEKIYRTGDIAQYTSDGMLQFVGRKDFQIKHMGHRIELGEIESAFYAIPGIVRVCCIYENEKIHAFYEGNVQKNEIVRALTASIPKFMIPNVLVNVAGMPLTKNGKIDRRKLMEEINNDN